MSTKSILIIDKDDSNIKTLKAVLEEEGYEMFTAQSGKDGLKLIDTEPIDLVLLEVWLPEMDGIEALQEIKKRKKNLPVIMMSSHANIDQAIDTVKLGAYDFLEKPLSIEKVLIVVKMVARLL